MNYFDHPYVSNSALSKLKSDLSKDDAIEYANALRMGTLIDCMITEPDRIDFIRMCIGSEVYTAGEIALARKMKAAFMVDPWGQILMQTCRKQAEFYVPGVTFEQHSIDFELDCKCKYDFFNDAANWGADLKSTSATNQLAFERAAEKFGYYRQAYFYMKLKGSDRFMIRGISKINLRIFPILITAGSERWTIGRNECNELAYKYWALKPVAA